MKVSDEGKHCSKKPEIEKSELASAKSLLTIKSSRIFSLLKKVISFQEAPIP